MYISKGFERTYLSEDVYIVKRTIFADYDDVQIRKTDGEYLFEGKVWDICFNANYMEVSPFQSRHGFIYVVKENRKILETDPDYPETRRHSNLYAPDGGCAANYCSGAERSRMRRTIMSANNGRCHPAVSKKI